MHEYLYKVTVRSGYEGVTGYRAVTRIVRAGSISAAIALVAGDLPDGVKVTAVEAEEV